MVVVTRRLHVLTARSVSEMVFQQSPVKFYIELDFNFVFGADACFSWRRKPEIGLFYRGLAGVPAIHQRYVDCEGPRLLA